MKLVVCFLGLLTTLAVYAQDCDNKKVDNFVKCIQGKLPKEWTSDLIKERHEAIDKCFEKEGCEKPDYEKDVFDDLPQEFRSLAQKMTSDWQSAPADVKDCIFKDAKDILKTNINKCLVGQKVTEIKDIPDGVLKFMENKLGVGDTPEEQKFYYSIFEFKTNIVRSFRKCYESKGKDSIKRIWSCFQDARKEHMFDQMCTDKTSCEKDNLDDTCIKRRKDIDDALCKCDKVKRHDLEKIITDLRAKPDADLDKLVQLVWPDHTVDDVLTKVKSCYDTNKEPLPASFKLIETMKKAMESATGNKLQFDKATIDTIHDITRARLQDEKCYLCKKGDDLDKKDMPN